MTISTVSLIVNKVNKNRSRKWRFRQISSYVSYENSKIPSLLLSLLLNHKIVRWKIDIIWPVLYRSQSTHDLKTVITSLSQLNVFRLILLTSICEDMLASTWLFLRQRNFLFILWGIVALQYIFPFFCKFSLKRSNVLFFLISYCILLH